MLTSTLLLLGLGLTAAIGLAIASRVFYVWEDPKVLAVTDALPGANCGGCGHAGCAAAAEAVAAGKAPVNVCVVGGMEVAQNVGEIMGQKVEAREPEFAWTSCTYGVGDADRLYAYNGASDCRAAVMLYGGSKHCPIGCVGLGSCVKACQFGALSMGPDNLPKVDLDKCVGCGKCAETCPKKIISLSSNSGWVRREFTTEECTAPCQRACPAGVDVPTYVHQIGTGEHLEAVRTIKRTNPFPTVCGRICVHPCEEACRRNLVDEAVAINPLKRFATEYERRTGEHVHIPRAPASGRRVAVVGGGALGLTAAYFANRLGHEVTVFEATSKLGGLLRAGLPENRLPRDVIDWDIEGVLDAGVDAVTGKRLGKDFTISSLLTDGYDAVFAGTGGWDTQQLIRQNGSSEPALPGVRLLIDFLMEHQQGTPTVGQHVVIVGGGKAAFVAARACQELGAESVIVVLRTAREEWLAGDELAAAEESGIRVLWESALTRMLGTDDALSAVEIARLGGAEGASEVVSADMVLTGAGKFPELIYVARAAAGEDAAVASGPVEWETLAPYASPYAREDLGLFRPGEPTGDHKAVVEAIGFGRRAANSLHRWICGQPVLAPDKMIRQSTQVLNIEQLQPVASAPRQKEGQLPVPAQIADPAAEIALGITEEQAVQEAGRCLQCGLICYRHTIETN